MTGHTAKINMADINCIPQAKYQKVESYQTSSGLLPITHCKTCQSSNTIMDILGILLIESTTFWDQALKTGLVDIEASDKVIFFIMNSINR